MLTCDWCHKPIYGAGDKGWGFQIELAPFHSLALRKTSDKDWKPTVLEAHFHPKPCKDEFGWAIGELLDDREPLETDGPNEDVEEVEEPSNADRVRAEVHERRMRRMAWSRTPLVEKGRAILEALGEDRLTISELTERVENEPTESSVRSVVARLLDAREVDRKGEPRVPGGKAVRYRYFRRRHLEGPIADLERTFHAKEEED